MYNFPNCVICANCVHNGANYFLAYLSIPNIGHHSKLITAPHFLVITIGHSVIWLIHYLLSFGSQFFYWQLLRSLGAEFFLLSLNKCQGLLSFPEIHVKMFNNELLIKIHIFA